MRWYRYDNEVPNAELMYIIFNAVSIYHSLAPSISYQQCEWAKIVTWSDKLPLSHSIYNRTW